MSESPGKAASISGSSTNGRSSPLAGEYTVISTRSIDDSVDIDALTSSVDTTLEIKEAGGPPKSTAVNVAKLDASLEEVIRGTRSDPFAKFECAWEFEPDLSDIPNVPKTKRDFTEAITKEIVAVRVIQNAMMKYSTEINSRKHHFSDEILEFEITATIIACGQLQEVRVHLMEVAKEVQDIGAEDEEVAEELCTAYSHALPWICRCRQIIKQNHCTYKTNVSLASMLYGRALTSDYSTSCAWASNSGS